MSFVLHFESLCDVWSIRYIGRYIRVNIFSIINKSSVLHHGRPIVLLNSGNIFGLKCDPIGIFNHKIMCYELRYPMLHYVGWLNWRMVVLEDSTAWVAFIGNEMIGNQRSVPISDKAVRFRRYMYSVYLGLPCKDLIYIRKTLFCLHTYSIHRLYVFMLIVINILICIPYHTFYLLRSVERTIKFLWLSGKRQPFTFTLA